MVWEGLLEPWRPPLEAFCVILRPDGPPVHLFSRLLVVSWSCLGGVLQSAWRPLGPSRVRLVVSRVLVESMLAHLGASWDCLVASSERLAASWDASSGELGPKTTNPISD